MVLAKKSTPTVGSDTWWNREEKKKKRLTANCCDGKRTLLEIYEQPTTNFVYLGKFAVVEKLEQRAFAHRTVADQNQPELIVEHRVHHIVARGTGNEGAAERSATRPSEDERRTGNAGTKTQKKKTRTHAHTKQRRTKREERKNGEKNNHVTITLRVRPRTTTASERRPHII